MRVALQRDEKSPLIHPFNRNQSVKFGSIDYFWFPRFPIGNSAINDKWYVYEVIMNYLTFSNETCKGGKVYLKG